MSEEHFDAIVVGSGFGGSVMTYRLAEAGLKVCLLERGKPYPPGSFARSPHEMHANFWDPSEGLHGLFDLWSFRGLEALVASGLGGGSLIYANVLLRKDPKWFVQEDAWGGYEEWPIGYQDLEPHYEHVEKMLGAQQYPLQHSPYDKTQKTRALMEAASAASTIGLEPFLPNLAITFGDPPVPGVTIDEPEGNLHRASRSTCRLCGECDIGCNYGSKNTLDYTYLSAAKRSGACIRTRSEVRRFEPVTLGDQLGQGFRVHYVEHLQSAETGKPTKTRKLPETRLTCEHLILASGTLGSTYLLLESQRQGLLPDLSAALGSRFSGNGDLLAFARECHELRDGERVPRIVDPSYGPVITAAIRGADTLNGGTGRGFYIQDGGYPVFAQWMIQLTQLPAFSWRAVHLMLRYVAGLVGFHTDSNLSAELSRLIGPSLLSSSSLPLLGMGRDTPDGRIYLNRSPLRPRWSRLQVQWKRTKSGPYFDRLSDAMQRLTTKLDAAFVPNALSHLRRLITVHPLGGCPMGATPEQGVVDRNGEVWGYPGLFVTDGSAMPGPVGANPSLTIAAFADHCAERVIARHRTRHPAVHVQRVVGGT